jgi:purine nucleoside permease
MAGRLFTRITILFPRPLARTALRWSAIATALALGACSVLAPPSPSPSPSPSPHATAAPRPVKVMIVTLFGPEAAPWLAQLPITDSVPVPGLSAEYPDVKCTASDVCVMTTDMGHANAAASTMALVLSERFDLTHTYFIVTGIAGIDPNVGTLGSAAWARWLVDFGLQQEFDAREAPAAWSTGFVGIGAADPGVKPKLEYGTEVFRLDEALLQRALTLSRPAALEDNDTAKAYRKLYRQPAAQAAPSVIQCDTLAGDTWWHGERFGERASAWTRLLTEGQGTYCTTQQEDNATYESLKRGAVAERLDLRRVAVLRTGANFDRPHPGQTAQQSLAAQSGGFPIATANLYRAAWPLVSDIVARWPAWRDGVPPTEK